MWALAGSGAEPVARLYAFLIVVELAIDLPVRVLHSGIYATRRVYKPIWSMFVPTVVQLVILGFGFYLYPAAAIVIAIVLSNAIGIWITVHYCLEVYRLMGLRPRQLAPAGLVAATSEDSDPAGIRDDVGRLEPAPRRASGAGPHRLLRDGHPHLRPHRGVDELAEHRCVPVLLSDPAAVPEYL